MDEQKSGNAHRTGETKAKHRRSISPESGSLASLSYRHDAQKVPERSAVSTVVEYGGLDFLVGVELGANVVDGLLVGELASRAGTDV